MGRGRRTDSERSAAKIAGSRFYNGATCRTCNSNLRYTSNRSCVECTYVRGVTEGRIKPDETRAAKRCNEKAQEAYGDAFDVVFNHEVEAYHALFGVSPPVNRIYLSLVKCKHGHPRLRDAITAECMACNHIRGRILSATRLAERERRAAAISGYWREVGRPEKDELPPNLHLGMPCAKGHPGIRYKGGNCWHCHRERSVADPAPSLIWAALVA